MPLYALAEADLDMILTWRNTPEVRRHMYSHHEITSDEHRSWFLRMQQDSSARWLLYRDHANDPVGVVYFTEFDPLQQTAYWGFYAKPGAAPGTGTRILNAALEFAFCNLALHKLNAEALVTNTVSINLHKKIGFTQEGVFREQHFDGIQRIDVVRLSLLAAEWQRRRDHMHTGIEQPDLPSF
jgi:UDP-4-amino-4,6-dideoxy-N-acetyl-beta-L-altrosamine N-acetyltransferase